MRILRLIGFILFYFKEILAASLFVAWDIVTPKDYMKPGIVEVPVDLKKEIAIIAFANLVSMTPGSLTVDLSSDRKKMYVHVMYLYDKEAFIKRTKEQLEKRIQRIFE